MLTLFTEHISPRLRYTCQAVFDDLLSVPYRITDDKETIPKGDPMLNYSHQELAGIPFIRPHSLLFEKGIRQQEIHLDMESRFFHSDADMVEHDVLAASFYLLSRYEEYLEERRDQYGRYESKHSLMGKADILHRPLVDLWALELYSSLRKVFPSLTPSVRTFRHISTVDVDVAYAYRGRNWWRRTGSMMRDLKNMDFQRIKERKAVLKGASPDPFDTYEYLKQWHSEQAVEAYFFFLMGDQGPLDKNLSHRGQAQRELIKSCSTWAEVGIHPSMRSNTEPRMLAKETKRLEKILGKKVEMSRQHYLFLSLPETYRRLISQGIMIDLSMGYADHIGFRAGTCSPFRWYDLEIEEGTGLYLLPISAMDASLRDYQGLSPEQAVHNLLRLKEEVRSVSGTFISLWHNDSVSEHGVWKGWRKTFEGMFSSKEKEG